MSRWSFDFVAGSSALSTILCKAQQYIDKRKSVTQKIFDRPVSRESKSAKINSKNDDNKLSFRQSDSLRLRNYASSF